MSKRQISHSGFMALNRLVGEAEQLAYEEKRLAERKAANRAALLALISRENLITADSRTAAPGVVVKTRQVVKFDASEALAWALAPEHLPAAASILQVKREGVPALVALAMKDPTLCAAFEIYKPGYEAAARENLIVGMPVSSVETVEEIAITTSQIQTGPALRALFEVADPLPAETDAEEEFEYPF